MNICVITGNLGADPENHFTAEGSQITTFSLAFRPAKDKTGWIKVTCFNSLAQVAEKYLHKGAKITVSGSLDHDKWEKDGQTHSMHKLIARNIDFIKTDGRGFDGDSDDVPF